VTVITEKKRPFVTYVTSVARALDYLLGTNTGAAQDRAGL
jgi:hypothetical protein